MSRQPRRDRSQPDWVSIGDFDARYASVVMSVVDGAFAVALIDSNSDGREIAVEIYEHCDGGWGIVDSLDDVGEYAAQGFNTDIAWAYGRAGAGQTVTIEYRGELADRVTSAQGWWAFVGPVGEIAVDQPFPKRIA